MAPDLFSLAELNQAVAEPPAKLNGRPFPKLPGSRRDWHERIDRPALRPLPAEPYELAEWKRTRVDIDCHIELTRHFYSVPYALIGETVDVRHTASTVEVFHKGRRVAAHRRSHEPGKATTLDSHRPKCHRRYLK